MSTSVGPLPDGPDPRDEQAIYAELRRIAQRYLSAERAGHTLQPTALVNEAYLRLSKYGQAGSKAHLKALMAQIMRRILIDHARARAAERKARADVPVELIADFGEASIPALDVLALHEVLEQLERSCPEEAGVVQCRFFAGMSYEEIAEVQGVSVWTIGERWRFARAWLLRELSKQQ
jgi:RNA polymerase sigma-70 factor (ECF subfamily)